MSTSYDGFLEGISELIGARSAGLLELSGVFVLVVARMAGMAFVLPGWKSGVLTVRTRLAGVLVLSLVTLPVLCGTGDRLPGIATDDPAKWIGLAVIEAAIGGLMGLGVVVVLAGLRGAGEIIDRQAGWGLAGVLDPGGGEDGAAGTRLLAWTAVGVLFVMAPINGHLLMVESLLGSMESIPLGQMAVGESRVPAGAGDLAVRLVHQSLVLTVQVAAPVLALMSLVTVLTGVLGRVLPETNLLVVAMPARVLVSLLVLGVAVTGAGRVVVDTVPGVLREVSTTLVGAGAR